MLGREAHKRNCSSSTGWSQKTQLRTATGPVRDLVAGAGLDFKARGEHELKGVPGNWKLFAITTDAST